MSASVRHLFQATQQRMIAAQSARSLCCGITYLQRVGRGGQARLWTPQGQSVPVGGLDWVAVHQVEILQESSAQTLESMEIEEGLRSIREHAMMRAGGLRLIVLVAGTTPPTSSVRQPDERDTFERHLRGKLQTMDRMRWLAEPSQQATQLVNQTVPDLPERLPHLYTMLHAARVFRRMPQDIEAVQELLARVEPLATDDMRHDVMIGLKQPRADLSAQRRFNRLSERLYLGFVSAIISSFAHFNLMPAAIHMRSYGDHLKGRIIQPPSNLQAKSLA